MFHFRDCLIDFGLGEAKGRHTDRSECLLSLKLGTPTYSKQHTVIGSLQLLPEFYGTAFHTSNRTSTL